MAAMRAIRWMLPAVLLASGSAVMAQDAGANPPPPPDGQQRRFDPAQMRQRMAERMKTELGVTDEEFKALQPKLEHVAQLQRDVNAGRMAMFRRQGGDRPADENPSPVMKSATELQTALSNKDSKAEDIKAKLDAFRQAKAKAKEELASAQQDLRGLLTQRQEAALVVMGMLD